MLKSPSTTPPTSPSKEVKFALAKRVGGEVNLREKEEVVFTPTSQALKAGLRGGEFLKGESETEKRVAMLKEIQATDARLLTFEEEEAKRRLLRKKETPNKCGPCSIL